MVPGKERRELTVGISDVGIIGRCLRLWGGKLDWGGPK